MAGQQDDEDAYVQAFASTVTEVVRDEAGTRVALAQTAFYPGGGGQPNDLGAITIVGLELGVEKVKKEGDQIWHWLVVGDPDNVAVGAIVQGQIDWTRRYQLMRTHTAMHILCGTVFRDYGAQVTGGDMEPLEGRMDFEFANLSGELVQRDRDPVNEEVAAARDAHVDLSARGSLRHPRFDPHQNQPAARGHLRNVRTVEIRGLDLQADGCTYVANTSEVGRVHVVDYKSKGKISKRIYIELG